MIFDTDFGKLQILIINTYIIILKATTLNPYKLKCELKEVDSSLHRRCDNLICHHVLIFLISLLIIAKFLAGYVTLASSIIAIFPILAETAPQLLLPAIVAQAIDYVLLHFLEALLGYFTLYFYAPTPNSKVSILVIFLTSMTLKIGIAIPILNIYSDYYNFLNSSGYNSYDSEDSLFENEEFIKSQDLTRLV